jgi:hypothetical protein
LARRGLWRYKNAKNGWYLSNSDVCSTARLVDRPVDADLSGRMRDSRNGGSWVSALTLRASTIVSYSCAALTFPRVCIAAILSSS